MKRLDYSILASLILATTSCAGSATNSLVISDDSTCANVKAQFELPCSNTKIETRDLLKLPPLDEDVSRGTLFENIQAKGLLRVLNKIVENEKKQIGLLGEWHLGGVRFDCIVDGKASSGWFRVTDAVKSEVVLIVTPKEDVLFRSETALSGISLSIKNHIYDICGSVGCNVSSVSNIRVLWWAGDGGIFYKGTTFLNDDGSVRNRLYGSL